MPVYIVEATYHLPVYRQRRYEAPSLEDACRLAVEDEDWDDKEVDFDTSGEPYVTGIWENAERAYDEGRALMIPREFHETVQRKADLFDRLIVLLREAARPMGLTRQEFAAWLPKAVTTLEDADAIDGR